MRTLTLLRAKFGGLRNAGAIALAFLFATSCGGSGAAGPVPVASVGVSLASSSIGVGENTTATATPRDAQGGALTGRAVAWSSSDASVATVSAQGLVTGVGAGIAIIGATSEGRTGSATLTVRPPPVASVTVSLPATLAVGQSMPATATLKDAHNNVLTGRVVTWSSDNAGVAFVDASGMVFGIAAGSANITATSEGQTGSAPITITAPDVASISVSLAASVLPTGSHTQATAVPKDANGNPVAGKTMTWWSDNQAIATVSSSGVVTAVATGTTNINATVASSPGTTGSPGISGSAPITVGASVGYGASTEKVRIVDIGTNFTPTVGSNASGIAFVSRSTSIVNVNSQGVITGVSAGQAWVVATAPGFAADSVYVIVPKNANGPVLRTDLTNYLVQGGGTAVTVNVLIDTRATPIGGAELSIGFTTSPVVFQSIKVTAVGNPAPVVNSVQSGVYRVSLASGTALNGQVALVQITFNTSGLFSSDVNRLGYITLNLLDIVDPTGSDLSQVSTSTRFPIIIQ